MYSKVTLYLSKDGDYVELDVLEHTSRSVNYATDDIHPILKAAEFCNSYDKVLVLLNNIKASNDCQEFVHLYHHHHPDYAGHHKSLRIGLFVVLQGSAHPDSIDQLIEFVLKRQQDLLKPRSACTIM